MLVWSWTVLALAAAAPPVVVENVDGTTTSGSLQQLTQEQVVLLTDEGTQELPRNSLIKLQPQGDLATPEQAALAEIQVTLLDGSHVLATSFSVSQGRATIGTADGGQVAVATDFIDEVRFHRQDDSLRQQWDAIANATATGDMLVIRKMAPRGADEGSQPTMVLDQLSGLLFDIDDQKVGFEFDGTRVDVPRGKIEGLIYYHGRSSPLPDAVCRVRDTTGSEWSVRTVAFDQGRLSATTPTGIQRRWSLEQVVVVDFSTGNIEFLDHLEPVQVQWRPFIASSVTPDSVNRWFQPKLERGISDPPLQLGGVSYSRGVTLHSRTEITYPLNGKYRRFLAKVGVDDGFRNAGNVYLRISTEDEVLVDRVVRGADPPFGVDLDVQDASRLQILVDFGDDHSDQGDHLNLCNARLLK